MGHPNKQVDISSSICGLCNSAGGASYANALIQCIFRSLVIRQVLLLTPEEGSEVLNASALIQFVHDKFSLDNVQDPVIFLERLCDKVRDLQQNLKHEFTHLDRCKVCNYMKTSKENNIVLSLSFNNIKEPVSLDDLIKRSLSCWYDVSHHCDNCGHFTDASRKTCLSSSCGDVKRKISSWKLKAVPTTIVNNCGDSYSVHSAVLDGKIGKNDHYISLLVDKKTDWIKTHDTNIAKMRWPRNSKDWLG
ncbi:uncharacterized protein LOC135164767 [Diachasmimorpha longicaudata]|uniref:uncharacterized protein LOC135164767 n=1 Tax=Diachasmimorpha longicaudata TaxID=58733 RepID=UPI0030B89136